MKITVQIVPTHNPEKTTLLVSGRIQNLTSHDESLDISEKQAAWGNVKAGNLMSNLKLNIASVADNFKGPFPEESATSKSTAHFQQNGEELEIELESLLIVKRLCDDLAFLYGKSRHDLVLTVLSTHGEAK